MLTSTANDNDAKTSVVIKWFVYGFALGFVALNIRGIAGFVYAAI